VRGVKQWVITDTHLYHDAMVTKGLRKAGFTGKIFARARLPPDSTLYHLGDVLFYRREEVARYVQACGCRVILIRGNHDTASDSWYVRQGFSACLTYAAVGDILLSHRPVPPSSFPPGITGNLHGHWHGPAPRLTGVAPAWWSTSTHFSLSCEQHGYAPIPFDSVRSALLTARGSGVPDGGPSADGG